MSLRSALARALLVASFVALPGAANADVGGASAAPVGPPAPVDATPAREQEAASVDDARTLLERAENAYGMLECESALASAEALSARGGLPHDVLVRMARLLTLANAALDRDGAAREAAVRLYAYDPTFRIDSELSPKLRTPVLEARLFWRDQPALPGIEAVVKASSTQPSPVSVKLRDPLHFVARVEVRYRWGQDARFTLLPAGKGERVTFTVPEPPPGELRLDYFVRALDDKENVVLELGTEEAPRSAVALPPLVPARSREGERGRSLIASPVFWTIAGAVVAGSATGIYLATRPAEVSVAPTSVVRLGGGVGCGGQSCN
jgi:hypothetical protein